MKNLCNLAFVVILFLFMAGCVLPSAAATDPAGCPGCGMVWKDTCIPFEKNNESAYNEELIAAFAPVAANQTPTADYRNISWTRAFLAFHNDIKERYAFTRQRSVDFDSLNATYTPLIAAAEKKQDKAAYYRAIRQYLYSIPDGHVVVLPTEGEFGAKYADIGGGYGITMTLLDSDDVIVSYVANGSAAEKIGIKPGDKITGWNGKEIHDAINATSYIWAVKKPSTHEGILLQQTRLLARDPVGSQASVKITYGGIPHPRTLNLTAYDDAYDTLSKSTIYLGKPVNDIGADNILTDVLPQISNDTVTYRTLPGGYSYIGIYKESYEVYQPFRAAMLDAVTNNSPGIVIDLRYNNGGDDNLAACYAGWFVDKPVFYEYGTTYDRGSRKFTILTEAWAQPQVNAYHGPVAVLVSPDTISSGEGLPMIFTRSGRGKIISWYGTNGAFGMNNVQGILPLGMYVFFPNGASLDETRAIQVDSNATLSGGISPQIRVPLNESTVARAMAGEDVQLTYAMEWLDEQQATGQAPPVVTATTATPAQKATPGIAMVIIAVGILAVVRQKR